MNLPSSINELRAWIRLSLEPGLGPVQARALLAAVGLPDQIYASPAMALAPHIGPEAARELLRQPDAQTLALIDRTLEWASQPGHHIITLPDAAYPAALLDTHDPPLLLYLNGHPECLSRPAFAMVGARSATAGGIDNAKAFSRYLAAQGWCIVSGLASGIDAAAHQGALEGGSDTTRTIAVLGTGIDLVYPAANRSLAHQIAAYGALVSEYPLGTRARRHQFPRRNRIIAGLARGVLVVEAARQSGSLITAHLATEIGREVFAIPGSIHSPMSRGCHALIRQGAKLVESGEDIQEELRKPGTLAQLSLPDTEAVRTLAETDDNKVVQNPNQKPPLKTHTGQAAPPHKHQQFVPPGPGSATSPLPTAHTNIKHTPDSTDIDDPVAREVYQQLSYDPTTIDTLAIRCQLQPAPLGAALLQLELADKIERLADGRYQRRPTKSDYD